MGRRHSEDPRDLSPMTPRESFGSWAYGEADRAELGDRATRKLHAENRGSREDRARNVAGRALRAKRS